jgi:hypothetical protein
MSKRTLAILVAAISVVGVLYVLRVTLWWRVERRAYNCAVCAAGKSRETLRIFGIPVRDVWSEPRKTPLTDIYDECIGDAHEHQQAGGGWSVTAGRLGSGRLHSDRAHAVPPFPFWQPRLTATALEAVGRVTHWPADQPEAVASNHPPGQRSRVV